MAHGARWQPRYHEQALVGRTAAFVRRIDVGDQPALDDRERLAVCGAPFDRRVG
jgi:hypothetical protein